MFNRKEYIKQYAKNHPEKEKEKSKRYREKNKNKIKEYSKQYREKNKEKINERKRQLVKTNNEYQRLYRKENSEKVNNNRRRYEKERKKIDLKYNLNYKIVRGIRISLKGNKAGRHWETLVEYTLEKLIKRLKKTMPKGYNWDDFLEGKLHIDHIIPKSVYNFTEPTHQDFLNCWALSNIRLLPAKENLMKSNKLTKPFQPALKLDFEVNISEN